MPQSVQVIQATLPLIIVAAAAAGLPGLFVACGSTDSGVRSLPWITDFFLPFTKMEGTAHDVKLYGRPE